MQEDGNGRVLDTGLRGDPPALEVLDGLLKANEFLAWLRRGPGPFESETDFFMVKIIEDSKV